MDIEDFLSSDSQDNRHSAGHETISTDTDRHTDDTKTKQIRKKYEPLHDCGKVYRYEDNPAEYRKIRKKVQNRESATRVRGRKKNAFENLQQETEHLRRVNAQLQLHNARLETENKTLKQQVEFIRNLIKPVSKEQFQVVDPIDEFISPEALQHPTSSYDSPFESQWARIYSSEASSSPWITLAVFTLVLAVFVIPSGPASGSVVAYQQGVVGPSPEETWSVGVIGGWLKQLVKYVLIGGYVWLAFGLSYKYFKRHKLKKV